MLKIPNTNFELVLLDIGTDTNTTTDGKVITANIHEVTYSDVGDKNITDLTHYRFNRSQIFY